MNKKTLVSLALVSTLLSPNLGAMSVTNTTVVDLPSIINSFAQASRDQLSFLQDQVAYAFNFQKALNDFKNDFEKKIYDSMGTVGPSAQRIVKKCLGDIGLPDINIGFKFSALLPCGATEMARLLGLEQAVNTKMSISGWAKDKVKDAKNDKNISTKKKTEKEEIGFAETVLSNVQKNINSVTSKISSSFKQNSDTANRQNRSASDIERETERDQNENIKASANIVERANSAIAENNAKVIPVTEKSTLNDIAEGVKKVDQALEKGDREATRKEVNAFSQKYGVEYAQAKAFLETDNAYLSGDKNKVNAKLLTVPTINGETNLGFSVSGWNYVNYDNAVKEYSKQVDNLNEAVKAANDNANKLGGNKGSGQAPDYGTLKKIPEIVGISPEAISLLSYYQSTTAMANIAASSIKRDPNGKEADSINDAQKQAMDIAIGQAILQQLVILNQNVSEMNTNLANLLVKTQAEQAMRMNELSYEIKQVRRTLEFMRRENAEK